MKKFAQLLWLRRRNVEKCIQNFNQLSMLQQLCCRILFIDFDIFCGVAVILTLSIDRKFLPIFDVTAIPRSYRNIRATLRIANQSTSQLLCCENVNSFWCQKQVKIFFVKFLCRNDIENWFKISITNCRSHCDVRYWSYCSTNLRRFGNGESWPKFPTNLRDSNVLLDNF